MMGCKTGAPVPCYWQPLVFFARYRILGIWKPQETTSSPSTRAPKRNRSLGLGDGMYGKQLAVGSPAPRIPKFKPRTASELSFRMNWPTTKNPFAAPWKTTRFPTALAVTSTVAVKLGAGAVTCWKGNRIKNLRMPGCEVLSTLNSHSGDLWIPL